MGFKHGHSSGGQSPTYKCWAQMKHRCSNSANPQYGDYGGRGISVCVRWLEFNAFLEDMGEQPPGFSLDRIDNNDGYHPGNCKWSTRKEQQNNRRNNVLIACYSGRSGTKTVAEWSRIVGEPHSKILKRLKKWKWPPKQCVFGKPDKGANWYRLPA